METDVTMESNERSVDPTAAAYNDPHGSGSMGPRPTQANFLAGLALALVVLMVAATAFVMLSALTYSG
ncbi:MAG TPA: hypothetical protein VGN80_16335 [Devosiaceae bacterium]|jgi:hypothetical protein|nr:hypothetical protein [Devosiaceae bacterium]